MYYIPILYIMISIKENKKINFTIPEFNCDSNPIGEHLNKYDMLSHLNCFSNTAIIGKPGSGKTSLLISMLTGKKENKVFRKCFDHILVIMPPSSIASMKKNIFQDHDPDKLYDELNEVNLQAIQSRLNASSKEKESTLLIMDDVGAALKDSEIQKTLKQIIYNRRHLKVHIVMLLQSYKSCPIDFRKMMTNIFIFKPSKKEFETLFDELFEVHKHKVIDIMRLVYDKPHNYLMLNIESQRMYKGFDEIIIGQN
jgi:nucleoside-triphosphatase THEP1